VDTWAGVGFGKQLDEQWKVGAVVGGGFAGSNAYGDSDAYYAVAELLVDYEIADDRGWVFMLGYNGNRSFLPDVPLPALMYYDRTNPDLEYALGVPVTTVRWRPADRWTLTARYT